MLPFVSQVWILGDPAYSGGNLFYLGKLIIRVKNYTAVYLVIIYDGILHCAGPRFGFTCLSASKRVATK